jgi:hypothetical protein
VTAVGRHYCSLCVIVLLIRDFLTALRDVAGILRTTSAHVILRDTHVRLLARASINNRTEASVRIVSRFKWVQKFGKENLVLVLRILILLLKVNSRVKW